MRRAAAAALGVGVGLFAALALDARAARGDARDTAEVAKLRVVKIAAVFGGDSPGAKHGFGLVVGQRDGSLYIATANHVVRSDIDDAPAATTTVQFFSDQGVSHPATVLETHRRAPLDLAVLRIAGPPSGLGSALCDDSQALRRDLPVAYVGRDGEWYVPTTAGTVNSDAPDEAFHVEVDFSHAVAVKEGTSGAPLLSERGLLGLVIQDTSTNIATVLAIDAVARAFKGWNHPWAAVDCPKPPPLLAASGFELGLRAALGLPYGAYSANGNNGDASLTSEVKATIPLGIEAAYRFTTNMSLGALFQYGDVRMRDLGCGYVGPNCGGTQVVVALLGRYRYQVRERFDVWGGLGAGYEWLVTHGAKGSVDHRGIEDARIEAGGDIVVTNRVTVGPFLSLAIARFDWGKNTIDAPGSDEMNLNSPDGADQRRWHQWLMFGVRMNVAVVR